MRFATCVAGALFIALALVAPNKAICGEFNSQLEIGEAAPVWKDLPGIDGKQHSLADLEKAKLVVVVFTANSCDVAADYEDRIMAFAKKHQNDVAVVAICVSTKPADSLPNLKRRAEEKKFAFTYLSDSSQAIGKAYGVNFTPEFFLLDAKRRIAYMGSMDDSTYADRVQENYLEAAVTSAMKGVPPKVVETMPRGCRIRYPRSR